MMYRFFTDLNHWVSTFFVTYPSSEIKSERCTVLAKSTRICSCSMVATVWTASTKMPTSLSCFHRCSDNAGSVPLRYSTFSMCLSFPVYSYVQPQLNNCTSFYGLHWNLILWHPTWNPFASCPVAYSAPSTIQPRQRLAPWIGPKSMGASCCDGDTHLHHGFGGNSLSPRVQCTHNPALFGHFPKETLSIWNHAFHLRSTYSIMSRCVQNYTKKHYPAKPSISAWVFKCCFLENITGACRKCWHPGRFLMLFAVEVFIFSMQWTSIPAVPPLPA